MTKSYVEEIGLRLSDVICLFLLMVAIPTAMALGWLTDGQTLFSFVSVFVVFIVKNIN